MFENVPGIARVVRPDGGSTATYYEVRCRRCRAAFSYRARVFKGAPPSLEEEVMGAAHKAGWRTWDGPRKCLCPGCLADVTAARIAENRKRSAKTMVNKSATSPALAGIAAFAERVGAAPVPVAAPVAEAPRQPGFEERRIILAKLNEVYLNERDGYAEGWSDRKVGTDLGVPWAWVAELREANFGPARDSEDWRALKADCEALSLKAHEVASKAAKCEGEWQILRRELEDIRAHQNRIERRQAELAKVWA